MQGIRETVLVIDDDAGVRDSLVFALAIEGIRARSYGSGAELLAERDLSDVACLVVDHGMPEMGGLELVRHLRRRGLGCPAILITGIVSATLRQRALESGVLGVVEKPFTDGALFEQIRAVLARLRESP